MFKNASRIGRACVLAGLVGATGVAAAGCADAQPTLVVLRAVPFDDNCVAQVGELRVSSLTADVGVRGPILANFVVTNQQPDVSADESNTLTNTSEVTMKDVLVKLTLPQIDGFEPIKFKQKVPSDSVTGNDEFAYTVEIPEAFVDQVAGQAPADGVLLMNMEVTFRALRASNEVGNDLGVIEARPFVLPIRLCNGCSLSCQETFATDDPSVEVCFAFNNCQFPPTVQSQCGGIQSITATPTCCEGTSTAATVAQCQ